MSKQGVEKMKLIKQKRERLGVLSFKNQNVVAILSIIQTLSL